MGVTAVERHQGGLVVLDPQGEWRVLYDDVDQVWFELDRITMSPMSAMPLVHLIKADRVRASLPRPKRSGGRRRCSSRSYGGPAASVHAEVLR